MTTLVKYAYLLSCLSFPFHVVSVGRKFRKIWNIVTKIMLKLRCNKIFKISEKREIEIFKRELLIFLVYVGEIFRSAHFDSSLSFILTDYQIWFKFKKFWTSMLCDIPTQYTSTGTFWNEVIKISPLEGGNELSIRKFFQKSFNVHVDCEEEGGSW